MTCACGCPCCGRIVHKDDGPGVSSEAVSTHAGLAASTVPSGPGLSVDCTRIPPEALAAVERVLAFRAQAVAEVPGQERWRSTSVEHQASKAASHALEAYQGVTEDHETGEHPLAHAAARALLGLALALRDRQ